MHEICLRKSCIPLKLARKSRKSLIIRVFLSRAWHCKWQFWNLTISCSQRSNERPKFPTLMAPGYQDERESVANESENLKETEAIFQRDFQEQEILPNLRKRTSSKALGTLWSMKWLSPTVKYSVDWPNFLSVQLVVHPWKMAQFQWLQFRSKNANLLLIFNGKKKRPQLSLRAWIRVVRDQS